MANAPDESVVPALRTFWLESFPFSSQQRSATHRSGGRSQSRWLPLACGVFAFGLVWLVWGSLTQISVNDDESAYLLQAKIFGSGELVAPRRPLPPFFQQYHVFVEPVLAAKYPPGHSLLLTLGVWLGMPGLVPALLVAITAAILCSITQRLAGGPTAVLAVFLASTAQIALRFNPSYFSELTTAALFAIAWWTLFQYWHDSRGRWLAVCAAAVAWGGITRPLTMLAFAVPTGICSLVFIQRARAWRHVVPALATALAVIAIVPLWNARVVGDWRKMPHAEYARLYMPSDRLGFGASEVPPAAAVSADEQAVEGAVRRMHGAHSFDNLGSTAAERAANIVRGTWSYGGLPGLAILFAAGFLPLGILRLVIGTLLCVFGAYLTYAHPPGWTLYYLEFEAPLAFLTAVGLFRASQLFSVMLTRRRPHSAWRLNIQRLALVATTVWLVVPGLSRVLSYRRVHAEQRIYRERFKHAVAALPNAPSVLFVRYAPGSGHEGLVENVPDLSSAVTWIVHDRGAENAKLLALAPRRVAYLYYELGKGDTTDFRIERLDRVSLKR
jgi:hypothetical protein